MTRATLLLALLTTACASAPTQPPAAPSHLVTLRDGTLTVTADVSRCGALVGLVAYDDASGQSTDNIINQGDDTGREVQASLYDGHWAPDYWPCPGGTLAQWGNNPVQAGNACEQRSGGVILSQTPTSLTVSCTPRQWNAALGPSQITLVATVTLQPTGIVRLDYQVTNAGTTTIGTDNWHELPVAYLDASFSAGFDANGLRSDVSRINFTQVGSYIAVSDPLGWTVALVAPGPHPWSIGFGGDTKPTSWLQAWQWLELAPQQTGTATAWLVVGRTIAEAEARMGGVR